MHLFKFKNVYYRLYDLSSLKLLNFSKGLNQAIQNQWIFPTGEIYFVFDFSCIDKYKHFGYFLHENFTTDARITDVTLQVYYFW